MDLFYIFAHPRWLLSCLDMPFYHNFTADTICFIPWPQQTLEGQVEKPLELCPPPENSKPRDITLYPAENWGPAFHTH